METHLTLFPRVATVLKEQGVNDILLIGGGVIPGKDRKKPGRKGNKRQLWTRNPA